MKGNGHRSLSDLWRAFRQWWRRCRDFCHEPEYDEWTWRIGE